VQGKEDL